MKEKKSMKRVISAFVVLLLVGVLLLNNISSQPVLTVNVSGATSVEMCVQYDYDITIQNPSATETATNVVAVATIPAGFNIIDSGGGSVVGQQITWSIGTLDPLETWNTTITLEVTCTAVSGQILVDVTHDDGSSSGSIYLSVQPGAVTITKTPHIIQASVGDTVTWTITVESTGLGPIRNVVVQDILGAGLTYISSNPLGNNVGQTTTWNSTHIPALALMASGATVTITIDARVDACSNLENDAQATWGCNGTTCETEITQASVQLIPHLPDISYTLPNFILNYCTAGDQFTIPITNSGTGTAFDFELYVDFGPLSVVSVTSPAASYYDTDHFYVGDISPSGTVNLIFTLQVTNWCQRPLPSGSLLFRPQYEDECGNVFYPPVKLGSYSVQNGTSLTVSKTGAPVEIYLGESITYNLSVDFSGPLSCGGGSASNITVVDTIPDGFTVTNAGGGLVFGNTITWTVDPSTTPWSTNIILQAPGYDECETYCYTYAINTVTATMTDCCGCLLSGSASQTTALECEEYFDSEKTVSSLTNFEKCTDLYYTNTYIFEDNAWWDDVNGTDLKFYEEKANNQTYVSGSLSVNVNGNPITGITITDPDPQGRLYLDFSTSNFSGTVRNSTLVIIYTLKTTDSSLPACEASYSFYDWSILDTGKTGGVCQPDQLIQETVYATVNQGQMSVSINGLPTLVDTCGSYDITIDLARTSAVGAYDVEVIFPLNSYYITSITGYSPGFSPTLDTSNPNEYRWLCGDYFATNITAQIQLTVIKKCGTPSPLNVTVYWDGYCNDDLNYDRECSASAGASPLLVNASIFIKKTPELIYATTNQPEWKIYVTNSGSGTAYNVWVEDVLDSDLQYFSSSAVDLNGTAVPVNAYPNQDHNGNPINGVTWVFNEIPAGRTRVITLTADIIGCTNLDNDVSASWGCVGEDCQTPVTGHSRVAIPPANAVTTNELPTYIDLCGQETITVKVKNAGITTVYDVEVEVTLPPGLFYVPLSGAPSDPQDPSANPVKWTSTEIPALAAIPPAGDPEDTVTISFDVFAGCDFPLGNRTITSKVSYDSVCGELKTSQSSSILPVHDPHVTIQKDGRNVSTGGGWVETVNAEPGDTVEWRIRISNDGDITAQNVEFWDTLPSNMTFTSISPAPSGGSGTQADPWIHGNLDVGITATYLVQGTVDANECTENPTTNTACVWYGCSDNPTTLDVDPCRVPQVCNDARLRTTSQFNISQIIGTFTTCEGEITITVYNRGPTAYNVVITSFLPSGFVYDSMISGPVPTDLSDPTQPIWNIGNMLEGETVTLHFKVVDDGTSCNVVIPDINTVHVDFDNFCGDHYTRTNSANVSPLVAVLNVIKTPEHQNHPPGETATWTITVNNTGNYQAENVVVADDLSSNLINIVANNGSGGEVPSVAGNTVTWNLAAPIPIGGIWTATLSADITGFLGTDTVTASGYCATGCEYSTATDTSWVHAVEGLFKSPDLQTATIGEEITFDISSSYWGTSNYQNVQIIDTLPTGLEYVTSTYTDTLGLSPTPVVVGQVITWTLGDFTGPNTANITVTARVQNIPANFNGVILTNWAQTTGTENGIPIDIPPDSGDVQIIEPELTIDKQGDKTAGLPGDTVHYTITVQNILTSPAYDVDIQDVIPTGLILDPASITSTPHADSTTVVGNTITWKYDIIPNVGSTTVIVEYDAMIPPEGGTFTNTSTVIDYSSLSGDNPYERHYGPISDQWTVEAPGTDILKLTLNTTINIPSPGGIVYFELTITNTGAMALDPVKLIDIIPDGLTYIPGSSWVDSPLFPGTNYEPESIVVNLDGTQTLTWSNIWLLQPLPDMEPGDIVTVTFRAIVDPDRVGTFINKAIVIGTSVIGDVTDEDDSPIGVKAPAIKIVKSVDPSVTYQDGIVEFTMVVTNTGEVPLDPVEVVDVLPIGLTYADEADPVPDSVTVNPDDTTTIIWSNIGHLDMGESTKLEFKAIFNGEETRSINVATAKGTPPNGYPVYDDDDASVTAIVPPYIWKVLSYNGLYRCELCNMDDLFREAREMNIEFSEDLDRCCEPYDLIESLQNEIEKKGLETDPRYEQALELIEYANQCCDDAFETYSNDKYIESYRWSVKRCRALREAIELMIEILSET